MEHLIDKSAVVAEIERRIKYDEMVMNHDVQITELLSRELNTLYELLSFIKSIEVKSVNESLIRKIVDLNNEAGKHYDTIIKKEREKNGFSQLAIDLFDHNVDVNELRIQYIIENLKT